MKRILLPVALAASFLFSGCTAVFNDVRATFEYAMSTSDDAHMTKDEIAAFPYTALYANWDDRPQILIVLGYIDGVERHWITGDRETMVTRHGRVIRTAMLDNELITLSGIESDPLLCILETDCASSWVREAEFADPKGNRYSRTIVSEFEVAGAETIELPVGPREVVRVTERGYFALNESGLNKKEFTNTFWLEPDGHVVKSHQDFIPKHAAMTLTQVKWVGRDE